MFSKSKGGTPGKALKTQEKIKVPSILSADLHISGDLNTDGDIQLDGTIDGDITTNSLTVGPEAVVNGAIAGESVKVAGTVNGSIAGRVVELTSTARVTGDILHHSLSIEAGARIEGMCKHVDPDQKQTDQEPARPSLVVTETTEEATAS